MDRATNSVRSRDPVLMGSEDVVLRSSSQLVESQESPGGGSRKRRAPGESFCEPTGGSSSVSPSSNHDSPERSVRCRIPSSPPSPVINHETIQSSSRPSSPLPRGLLWITRNAQQHTPSPPLYVSRDEDAPSTVPPTVPSVGCVVSGTDSFSEPTGGSLSVSPQLTHSHPSSPLPRGLLWITQNVRRHSSTPPTDEILSTALPVMSSAVQVNSPAPTPQHFLTESPSASGCDFQSQNTLSSGVQWCSPTPPSCFIRGEDNPSTVLPAVSSAVQVISPTCTGQHFLLESPSAAGRDFQSQHIPSYVVQPSMSGPISLTRNDELPSPDFISVPENNMDATETLDSWSLMPDYGSDEYDVYYLPDEDGYWPYEDEQAGLNLDDEMTYEDEQAGLNLDDEMTYEDEQAGLNLDDEMTYEDEQAGLNLDDEMTYEDEQAEIDPDDELTYEVMLALGESIGYVNMGISSSEMHEFVKQIICVGHQNEEICIICLEAYHDGDTVGQLSCGHEYHCSCIARWIRENPSCPICKRSPRRHAGAS